MLTDLRLQNFRSYKDASFEFGNGVNIVMGPNASGKTSLLEGILVLARGGSYRVKDAELIQFGNNWLRLDGDLSSGGKRVLKIKTDPIEKMFEIDTKIHKRLSRKLILPFILFEPNHLQILTASPEKRRDYLDNLLEQTVSSYDSLLKQYKRILSQRNSLLKQNRNTTDSKQFFVWNVRLSQIAGQIVRARSALTDQIDSQISDLYKDLSDTKTDIALEYKTQWSPDNYESKYIKNLEETMELDMIRGFTGSGPHRDDLLVYWNDRPASDTSSRGETRTIVLALKIIELKMLEAAGSQKPLLLLDDVFSELDGKRRHILTDYLLPYQTFITTTDADIVQKSFSEKCNVIALR